MDTIETCKLFLSLESCYEEDSKEKQNLLFDLKKRNYLVESRETLQRNTNTIKFYLKAIESSLNKSNQREVNSLF